MPEKIPRCVRGHDLRIDGRDKSGHCVTCRRLDEVKRRERLKHKNVTGVRARFRWGEGFFVTEKGFTWDQDTFETPGRLKAIAENIIRLRNEYGPLVVEFAEEARSYLEDTRESDGRGLRDYYVFPSWGDHGGDRQALEALTGAK